MAADSNIFVSNVLAPHDAGASRFDDYLSLQRGAKWYYQHTDTDIEHFLQELAALGKTDSLRPIEFSITKRQLSAGSEHRMTYAVLIFEFTTVPAFLPDPLFNECRYGYAALVTSGRFLAVQHSTGWRLPLKTPGITPVEYPRLLGLAQTYGENVEKIKVRGLSLSPNALRGQSAEADDLAQSMSTTSAHRQFVQSTRFRDVNNRRMTVTLSTGYIYEGGERVGLEQYLSWCEEIARRLGQSTPKAGLFSSFATPLKLSELPGNIRPTAVLLNLDDLRRDIESGECLAVDPHSREPVDTATVQSWIDRYRVPMRVTHHNGRMSLAAENDVDTGIELLRNSNSYGVNGAPLGTFRLRTADATEHLTLRQWIKSNDGLQIVFDNLKFASTGRTLFQCEAIESIAETVNRMVLDCHDLRNVRSEKGLRREAAHSFDRDSIFHAIESNLAADADILICDDLGTEWADYIAVYRPEKGDPVCTLYHAKYGEQTLSASALHDVIAQALKNLGRFEATAEDVRDRADLWRSNYTGTQIARVRRNRSGAPIHDALESTLSDPFLVQQVVVVTNALSRSDLTEAIASVDSGCQIGAHVAQLFWLLVEFHSACVAQGYRPIVYCRPDTTRATGRKVS